MDQLHLLARRRVEADGGAVARRQFPGGEPLDRRAHRLHQGLGRRQVVLVLHLEAHVLQTVGRGEAEDHRVVLVLVPALQVDPLGLPVGLDEPEDLGVVGRRQLQKVDLRRPQRRRPGPQGAGRDRRHLRPAVGQAARGRRQHDGLTPAQPAGSPRHHEWP